MLNLFRAEELEMEFTAYGFFKIITKTNNNKSPNSIGLRSQTGWPVENPPALCLAGAVARVTRIPPECIHLRPCRWRWNYSH